LSVDFSTAPDDADFSAAVADVVAAGAATGPVEADEPPYPMGLFVRYLIFMLSFSDGPNFRLSLGTTGGAGFGGGGAAFNWACNVMTTSLACSSFLTK
jgi:hypothetical protein